MPFDIVVGRSERDKKKFGVAGTIFLGKQYVKMGQTTSLSNNVYFDVAGSHVLFICGKRGSGKSYTMGVIAEGICDLPPEVKNNISVIMLDTMGIYWTMKYPNKKEEDILKEWGLEPKSLDINIYTPAGYFDEYKKKGIPTDHPFSMKPSELDPTDWCLTFDISIHEPIGILIERIVNQLREDMGEFSMDDIIATIRKDDRSERSAKDAAENLFAAADGWGLFRKEGTPLNDLVKGGQVTVLDVSCYATIPGAAGLRALVIGLVAEKLFIQRMIARKDEEYHDVMRSTSILDEAEEEKKAMKKQEPLVWLVIDEAHEFLPNQGKTPASQPLITILREGRQPGISLILATQQPGKIHTDVMTQSDTVLSHRLTANLDVKALGMLMQSYMREGLDKHLNNLPSSKGSAIIFDDTNERMYSIKIRPRFTW
ncbi:MAG: DUF87 domain-containing protein, partial [Nanoarchaeota archaeon]|nr:DUF87 domain-containing protein [Nanoarchaeota archaeon]